MKFNFPHGESSRSTKLTDTNSPVPSKQGHSMSQLHRELLTSQSPWTALQGTAQHTTYAAAQQPASACQMLSQHFLSTCSLPSTRPCPYSQAASQEGLPKYMLGSMAVHSAELAGTDFLVSHVPPPWKRLRSPENLPSLGNQPHPLGTHISAPASTTGWNKGSFPPRLCPLPSALCTKEVDSAILPLSPLLFG